MAGGKLTPRQKMINMMYLVLTAMLALNVSAEVLDAFVKIEEGLQQTSKISEAKNAQTLNNFALAAADNKAKVEKWQQKALSVQEKTKILTDYIHALKIELVEESDGKDAKAIVDGKIVAKDIAAKDKSDKVNLILIGPKQNGKAYDLKKMIEEYKEYIFSDILKDQNAPGLVDEINGLLNFDVKKEDAADARTWENFTFEGMPLMSAIALLTKIQVDVQNSESSIYDYLYAQIDASSLKFTAIQAVVKPITSSAIVRGADFEAQIFLGAYDPSQSFSATLNGGNYQSDGGGKITYKRRGDGIGVQNVSGSIKFKGPEGDMNIPVKFEYQVVEPNLVVSPDKMNVFYLGVNNPVSISVSGVPMDKLNISISNATFTKEGSSFNVKPTAVGKCVVNVSANIDGVTKTMPSKEFRVKRVPAPTPAVHGVSGKSVGKNDLVASEGMVAKMPADFEFDLKYDIKSFNVAVTSGGYTDQSPASSYRFTQQQQTLIRNSKSGDRVMFTDIKATGPGGVSFDLGDIVIGIK